MRLMSRHNLIRPNRLQALITILLLTFTFVDLTVIDLAFPELCSDEFKAMAAVVPAQSGDDAIKEARNDSGAIPLPAPDSQPAPSDEDCFCCCSHVLPAPHFDLAALSNRLKPGELKTSLLPLAPPRGAFRPPRLS